MSAHAPSAAGGDASRLSRDAALLRRYVTSGPRYRSYPGPRGFSDAIGGDAYTDALRRSNASGRPLSLYVHLPFCRQLCYFCSRPRTISRDNGPAGPYLARLDQEMALLTPHLDPRREIQQLYWGGGTPTFLSLDQMGELIDRLDARFGLSGDRERDYAIEIDPREADVFTLRHLQALGFNRLSLGVIDFDRQVQAAVNRVQPRWLTEQLIDEADRLGFRSLNLDLIHGLPGQTRESFADTLDQIIALVPPRLTLRNYVHQPERFAAQRHLPATSLPDRETRLAILQDALERLDAAGYVPIGVDQFAHPDDSLARAQREGRLRHTLHGFSTHSPGDLLGLGASAISQVADIHVQNDDTMDGYAATLDSGRLPIVRGRKLDFDDRLRGHVIERLLCDTAIDLDAIGDAFAVDAEAYLAEPLARLAPAEHDGLIERHGKRLVATSSGRRLLRTLVMAFDHHPPGEPTAADIPPD